MAAVAAAVKSSSHVSWKSIGKLQKTIAKCIVKSGIGLHSGKLATVKLWPESAGKGRYFDTRSNLIHASINSFEQSPLCTTLSANGFTVRTVEHLLSALEATGVDNCRIEVTSDEGDPDDPVIEVPILDGSAREWVAAIDQIGLEDAIDQNGRTYEKMAPFLSNPIHVPHIGCQWFSSALTDSSCYATDIAPSRTFCVYEEVEMMRSAGLVKGGSVENAIICSASKGWLNPPLRFGNEPCRHKALDLIGDLSLFAHHGSQGVPVAHIVAYKAGHALHAEFVRCLTK